MIDFNSQTWKTLTTVLHTEMEPLRQRLEQVGLPNEEANALRGEIRRINKILAMATPLSREGGGSPDYGLTSTSAGLL